MFDNTSNAGKSQMAHYESPNWTGPPPPPPRSARMAFADWFARWGFALLTIFFLLLVAAAMYLLPDLRASQAGLPPDVSSSLGGTAQSSASAPPVFVSISSVPSGARVEIDVDSVGITPVYLLPIERSVHLLSLELDGYERIDTLLYDPPSDTSSFLFVLSPAKGRTLADGRTDSDNADTDHDATGDVRTESGGAARESSNRPSSTRVERPIEPTPERPARNSPSANTSTEVVTPPPPTKGSLTVSSAPLGAVVYIDGADIGTTPTALGDVEPGPHDVVIRLSGYNDYRRTVNVVAGQSAVVQASMVAAPGELAILVQPWGSIYIDGRLVKRDVDIEFRTSIPAGEHALVASHPSLGRITRTVRVVPGTTKRIVFDLNKMNVSESEN